MKKMTTCLLISIFGAISIIAQEDVPNEIDYYGTLFGMEKQAIVELYISLNDSVKSEAFWPIYNKYENERKALGQSRIDLLKEYIANYATLDDMHTDDLIDRMEKQSKNLDRLIYKYSKRMRNKVGSKEAAQFYQIEYFLLHTIRADVLEHMPFIGEFD
jgi:CRISPR-associated protein Cas8b1/Cst1 subtype I-B